MNKISKNYYEEFYITLTPLQSDLKIYITTNLRFSKNIIMLNFSFISAYKSNWRWGIKESQRGKYMRRSIFNIPFNLDMLFINYIKHYKELF